MGKNNVNLKSTAIFPHR